jgi:rhamnose transport system permease protein
MTQVQTQKLIPDVPPPSAARGSGFSWKRILATPELMVGVLLIAALIVCVTTEPAFRDAAYLFRRSSRFMEIGVMAVGMSFVIIGGQIDLSCASILALVGATVTTLSARYHVPFWLLLVLTPVMGAVLGGINGVVVARLGLPSLVVTLGTMAAYRGLAQVLVGQNSLPVPAWFTGIDRITIGDRPIAMPLVIFLITAIVLGLVLHRTVYGRWVFAIGINADAARYAGVPVAGVTTTFFILSGILSSLAALMMMSRQHNFIYSYANGWELDVITTVVLGGTIITGGRGTMFGSVIALFLIFFIQTGMGLANISSAYQVTANGALLIFAVLATNFLSWLGR